MSKASVPDEKDYDTVLEEKSHKKNGKAYQDGQMSLFDLI